MKKTTYILALALFFTIASCTSKSSKTKTNQSKEKIEKSTSKRIVKKGFYLVTKVVDGDTFWVDNNIADGLKIRLIGVDAPESRNVFKKKKQPYGLESKAYLTKLLNDQYVRLEFDVDSLDQYGRTLAYAYLENGDMVNELIVKTGNGIVMTIAPNVKYEDLFTTGQRQARENSLGLWGMEISE